MFLITEADSDILRRGYDVVILGYELGRTGDIRKLIVHDIVSVQGYGHAVDFVADQLGRMHAEARGQHAVKRARASPALDMPGHNITRIHPQHLRKLGGNTL